MAALLDRYNTQMKKAGIKPRTNMARNWIMSKISGLRMPANRSLLLNDATRIASKAFIGGMYFYHYDAKHKDTLPVWDMFPLVLPMETYDDGFLGLNLHYLDPYARLALLDQLHDYITNTKYDDTTRFKLSYQILSRSRRFRFVEPCIKRYLFSHIMSSMIYIEPDSWEIAIYLPTQKFIYQS